MRSRILFVDDEPLMREFYSMVGAMLGSNYEVFTASSGKEGLEFLRRTPVDIVISDLVMPEMNGQEFMAAVSHDHPESMRIVISAHEDQLTVAQCLMFGHRYFSKPFDLKHLAGVLKRICHLKHQVGSEKLKRVISGLGALPTPPRVYMRLTEALNSPYSSIDEIGAIVQEDPALTLKLLQISNSAYFGVSQKIVTPMEAVQIVGLEILRALVLCIHAFKFYQDKKFRSISITELWDHSLRTATAARKLARHENLPAEQCEETFVSGLLHDIGKLILAANAEKDYRVALELSSRTALPLEQAEAGIFATTHAHVGAYLLALWGVPESVISGVELHHSLDPARIDSFNAAVAVHVAQNLLPGETRRKSLDTELIARLGLSDRLAPWEEAVARTLKC